MYYFFEYIPVVELKDEVIIVAELEVVNRRHEHYLSNSELLNPALIALDSQQVSLRVCLLHLFCFNWLAGIFIIVILLNDCLSILMLFSGLLFQ
jgi:hypothetical protein